MASRYVIANHSLRLGPVLNLKSWIQHRYILYKAWKLPVKFNYAHQTYCNPNNPKPLLKEKARHQVDRVAFYFWSLLSRLRARGFESLGRQGVWATVLTQTYPLTITHWFDDCMMEWERDVGTNKSRPLKKREDGGKAWRAKDRSWVRVPSLT